MSNIAANLAIAAATHPERTALLYDDASISYRKLEQASAQVGALLTSLDFVPGDRVGVMLPDLPEFATVYYGVLRAGGVVVPMSVRSKKRDVEHYLSDSGAKFLVAWHYVAHAAQTAAVAGAECVLVDPGPFAELLGNHVSGVGVTDRDPEDTAVIFYPSGTTGSPKGLELTHADLGNQADVMTELLSVTRDDVILGALPLFHTLGQTAELNTAIASDSGDALIPSTPT